MTTRPAPRSGPRRLLPLLLLPLAGCGFQPLYGSGPSSPTASLPAVYVDNIAAGHFGQLLREELQRDLQSPVSGADSRYRLVIGIGENANGIAIQADNSSTFTRIIGTATWTLFTVGIAPRRLASGTARTVDGFDQLDQQYFQSELSNDAVNTRVAANLADQVSLEVATWFRSARAQDLPALAPIDRASAATATAVPDDGA